jgi:hypothetical protein
VPKKAKNRYDAIIEKIFEDHYSQKKDFFDFTREEFEETAIKLEIKLPKNIGDVLYSFRYRKDLPQSITKTAPEGREWIIEGAGRAKYRFRMASANRIVPNSNLITIKVPDATPEIITAYAQSDEQALLAKVRYNRLIDIFLGITTYSLQNHLRTTVKEIGQIEIDEIYVGIDKYGRQFVIPVQAKGGSDKHGVVQTQQDIACCAGNLGNDGSFMTGQGIEQAGFARVGLACNYHTNTIAQQRTLSGALAHRGQRVLQALQLPGRI